MGRCHIAFANCLMSELDPHEHPLPSLQKKRFSGVVSLDTSIHTTYYRMTEH